MNISTFKYTTINFRTFYCRYVILHCVSFDLMQNFVNILKRALKKIAFTDKLLSLHQMVE
jgi:hypothetical protein